MANDSIENFEFVALRGTPVWPVEQQKVIQRTGVDGSAFLYVGRRSPSFRMRSIVDVEDMEAGGLLILNYQALCEDPPVAMKQGGVDWTAAGLYVKVLNVQIAVLRAVSTSDGGLNPPSNAILEAEWLLQGLEYSGAGSS